MRDDRLQTAYSLLRQHKDTQNSLIGYNTDPSSKKQCALTIELAKDSDLLQELESMGFKAIYPAELADNEIARMDEAQRNTYNIRQQNALIVDTKEDCLSLNLANSIANHVYSNAHSGHLDGLDTVNNAVTYYPDHTKFKEGTHENLQATLSELGYQTDLTDDRVTVHSNIPYPSVNKSKFAKIFEMAKNKIHNVAEKLGLNKSKEANVKQDDEMSI